MAGLAQQQRPPRLRSDQRGQPSADVAPPGVAGERHRTHGTQDPDEADLHRPSDLRPEEAAGHGDRGVRQPKPDDHQLAVRLEQELELQKHEAQARELLARFHHAQEMNNVDDALALAADVSQRHVSFLESGRATPSRATKVTMSAT